MRAQEFVTESVDADKVLQYVKQAHAPEQFDIEYSITDHPRWELKNIPISQLKLDPEGEQQDPYNRVNWVDYDKVQDLMPKISAVLKRMPIVVDSQGWIIDGNHRATAAAEAGLKSVPAYVPAEVAENFAESRVQGKKSFDQCYDQACRLYDRAEAQGLEPRLIQVAGFRGNGSDADPRWLKIPQRVWQHYVVQIGNTVLDPTAQQFGPTQPTKYSVKDLDDLWDKQYQIRPRVVDENFADGKVRGKSRPGRVKRAGASCAGSVTDLRAKAKKYGGERGKMYHWCANMKSGKKK